MLLSDAKFKCSYLDEISLDGLVLRSRANFFQKSLAGNYIIMRKIFIHSALVPRVSHSEYEYLKQFDFLPLEDTCASAMNEQILKILEYLHLGAKSVEIANKLFEIRVKELRYIYYSIPKPKLCEIENGYLVFEKYLEFIADYNR